MICVPPRVAAMASAMADADLPAPVFKEIGDTFVVTLYGVAARLRASLTPTPAAREGGRPLFEAQPQPPMTAPSTPLERHEWAVEHVRTVGPLSPHTYAAALGLSIDTAKRDLRALVAQGAVQAQGTTRDRRYVLAD